MSAARVKRASVAVAVIWLSMTALALAAPSPARAADLPFRDPAVDGYIGLCNKEGQPIDHGRVGDQPFVWSAIASNAAPAPYDKDGRTATLVAYQPREGLGPDEWSGELITASARYDNPAHPKAQSTDADEPLKSFVSTFPPSWDGLVQLRIYLGAPSEAPYSQRYAATVIRVSGDEWSVVSGGTVPCNVTNAVSMETLLLPQTTASTADPKDAPAANTDGPGAVTPPATDAAPVPSSADGPSGSVPSAGDAAEIAAAPTATVAPSTGGPTAAVIAAVAVAGLIATAAWVFVIRKRRPTSP